MRSRTYLVAAGVAVLAGTLTACGGGGDAGETGANDCTRAEGSFELVVDEESFTVDCIEVEAGSPTSFTMDNQDVQHHNLSVYVEEPKLPEDQAAPNLLFRSEDVAAEATLAIELPAFEPGDYFFRCDYHPVVMTGTLNVV